jgi:hypothetical protein
MSGLSSSRITYVFWATLLGTLSFLIGGVIGCTVILHLDSYVFATIIAGGTGTLLLGILLGMRKKIGMMAIAGIIAVPISILGSFILVEGLVGGFGLLFPSISSHFKNSSIPDISAIILMGIIFGAITGAILYGRKSILLFSAVCGIASFPFGLLVEAMNSGYWISSWLENLFRVFGKIDLNFLAIVLSFGFGMGLGIGIYSRFKSKSVNG